MRLIACFVVSLLLGVTRVLAAPIISVQPSATTVSAGQAFTVSISVSDAVDLYAFQFDLGFNPAVVAASNVTEGPFLPSAGSTFFIPGAIDNAAGIVTFTADSLLTAITGANGAGTLAQMSFMGLAGGLSQLNLLNVVLLDSQLAGITSSTQNASVTVGGPVQVPEPGTLVLLSVGVLLLNIPGRRREHRIADGAFRG